MAKRRKTVSRPEYLKARESAEAYLGWADGQKALSEPQAAKAAGAYRVLAHGWLKRDKWVGGRKAPRRVEGQYRYAPGVPEVKCPDCEAWGSFQVETRTRGVNGSWAVDFKATCPKCKAAFGNDELHLVTDQVYAKGSKAGQPRVALPLDLSYPRLETSEPVVSW